MARDAPGRSTLPGCLAWPSVSSGSAAENKRLQPANEAGMAALGARSSSTGTWDTSVGAFPASAARAFFFCSARLKGGSRGLSGNQPPPELERSPPRADRIACS